jgi:hypothetical protein
MKKTIVLTTLFCLVACSKNQISNSQFSKIREYRSSWELIYQIETEKWNKEKLLAFFGQPNEIIDDKNNAGEYLIYDDPNSGHQRWSFGINTGQELTDLTFIPNSRDGESFTEKGIIEKWGKNCKRKKDIDSTQHFIRYIYHLDCSEKHRAYFNNHNEVTSLWIQL